MLAAADRHAATNPVFDWHALAPEIVLVATIVVVLVADLLAARPRGVADVAHRRGRRARRADPDRDARARAVTTGRCSAAPTSSTTTRSRSKGFFLVATYVTILLSVDYISEGDYYKGEFYVLLLDVGVRHERHGVGARPHHAVRRARDDLDPHVRPRRVPQARPRVERSGREVLPDRCAVVGADALRHVADLRRHRRDEARPTSRAYVGAHGTTSLLTVAIFLSLVGFAFKVSAVPFHFWAPDTYEGAPTPVTAFLSVASKAGGFVALINIIYFGFYGTNGRGADSWWPVVWVLAALSMTLGNLAALRQTNIVRMLAYSSIAQGGFMLVPFAAAGIAGADGQLGVGRRRR